jgi:RHS repeat-associated protein
VVSCGTREGSCAYDALTFMCDTLVIHNSLTYKFTGKERDSESGLDNFGLRYDSSSLGRFMSPDSIANDWELANPQTWNRYAYARNNPLAYVDPDGAAVELIGQTDEERKKALAVLQATRGNNKRPIASISMR